MNISDIAQKAGVSTATVSRVINNSGRVKPTTREAVMRVIKENGFIPNAIARSLSVQSTSNIGVIFPDIENPFFSGALYGITNVADQNRYNVFFFNSDENVVKEQDILRMVESQHLAGIIITPIANLSTVTKELLEGLEKKGIPVVLLDRDIRGGEFSIVLAENEKGAYLAVSQLIREGHEKVAIIEGDPLNRPVYERSKGYRRAMDEYEIPIRGEYMVRGDQKSDLAYQMTQKLMSLQEPPTAIFTCSNMMTLGCLRYLTEHNLVLGRDVSLIGFDDISVLKVIDFKLSVVDRSEADMGRIAMRMLLNRLENLDGEREIEVLPVKLILRGSEKFLNRK
ncbi:MAG: LacI family DNA-binding transcriptional regulator [Lacrimispora sp.]|uniref:LacI family DNA-binding transcriptional regulator n=1 Tax=Lacrimispora sp. TaxID=2719234 RepID=UPI0039E280A2